jgi:predicted ATPase/DNA-binding SARP family transcriptional activator
MDAPWRIELLGGLRARQRDRVVSRFRTQKTGALFAYLACRLGSTHSRDALIQLFWPDSELAQARNSLSQAISSLRHQLEPPGVPPGAVILADRASVGLNPAACSTDVAEFEACLREAAGSRTAVDRGAILGRAAELYRRDLLPAYYDDWVLDERERLRDSFIHALHGIVQLLERDGEWNRALEYARQAVSIDPLREESHRALVRLALAAGEPGEALLRYRELERILEAELGVSPSPATRELVRDIECRSARAAAARGPAVVEGERNDPAARAASTLPSRARASPGRRITTPAPGRTGTVTFVVADRGGCAMGGPSSGILDQIARLHGGLSLASAGECCVAAFRSALDAAAFALDALGQVPAPLRMGLDTAELDAGTPASSGAPRFRRAVRMLLAAHPGQILCSELTAALIRQTPAPVVMGEIGTYRLRGVDGEPESLERLFQLSGLGAPPQFPPPRAEPAHRAALPLALTPLIGREAEIRRLADLLSAPPAARLVVLTGWAGVGKTRLALEAARTLAPSFRGAVWFVPLGDLDDPSRVLDAILAALRLTRSPGCDPLDQTSEFLDRQSSLLVLDNFEQLLPEGALTVETLLRRVESLVCLVTSRSRLGIDGERIVPVEPLLAPHPSADPEQLSECASVRLFVDRAQSVRPDFQVTAGNAAAIAQICARLEGIPLALELAAARAHLFTPTRMLVHLEARLDFLVTHRPIGAARHRALRSAFDWSYRLLCPGLQEQFAALSAFRGGWIIAAAEFVWGAEAADDALDAVGQLEECSLIVADLGDGEPRYRMLEALREYAAEQLDETARARVSRRHAEYYASLAEASRRDYERGAGMEKSLVQLDPEQENLRAALSWFLETEPDGALRLAADLSPWWLVRGSWAEARSALAQALEMAEDAPADLKAQALGWSGWFALRQGDLADAERLTCSELDLCRRHGDAPGVAGALHNLASIARDRGDFAAAEAYDEDVLALARQLRDERRIALALNSLGNLAKQRGDLAGSRARHEEALALYRGIGFQRGVAESHHFLGEVARAAGDCSLATRWGEEALKIHRELQDRGKMAAALRLLGSVAAARGDYRSSLPHYRESLALSRELGDRTEVAAALEGVAAAATSLGEWEHAARLFGAAAALRATVGVPVRPADRKELGAALAALRSNLGDPAFEAAWQVGQALRWEDAADSALSTEP